MPKSFIFLIIIFFSGTAYSQVPVRFDQLEDLQKKEKKVVMVFIEADWCKYCSAMKQSINKNELVRVLLEKRFYTVFLNAEEKNDISFAGKLFSYRSSGVNTGLHQLAERLATTNGQLSYPAVCFLNEKNEIIYQYNGYLPPIALAKTLSVVSGNQDIN